MSEDEWGGPGGPEDHAEADRLDEESAWAAIVAGYGDRVLGDPADDAPERGDQPGQPDTRGTDDGPDGDPARGRMSIFDQPAYDARTAWRRDGATGSDASGRVPAEHDESHDRYVPPEAPPLPRPRGVRGAAWVGVCGVPLLFLALTLLDVRLISGAGLLMLLWFVAGFGYLIGTMRDEPGDGWDDGARV